ncbi:uncharacterized protein LOC142333697 [Lycorma delicatula]|uniref:uncharacterized protein LOC142333697 n=1 Tax=Lycorma delicatula TaxID=130591 RepID=UPI003F51758D
MYWSLKYYIIGMLLLALQTTSHPFDEEQNKISDEQLAVLNQLVESVRNPESNSESLTQLLTKLISNVNFSSQIKRLTSSLSWEKDKNNPQFAEICKEVLLSKYKKSYCHKNDCQNTISKLFHDDIPLEDIKKILVTISQWNLFKLNQDEIALVVKFPKTHSWDIDRYIDVLKKIEETFPEKENRLLMVTMLGGRTWQEFRPFYEKLDPIKFKTSEAIISMLMQPILFNFFQIIPSWIEKYNLRDQPLTETCHFFALQDISVYCIRAQLLTQETYNLLNIWCENKIYEDWSRDTIIVFTEWVLRLYKYDKPLIIFLLKNGSKAINVLHEKTIDTDTNQPLISLEEMDIVINDCRKAENCMTHGISALIYLRSSVKLKAISFQTLRSSFTTGSFLYKYTILDILNFPKTLYDDVIYTHFVRRMIKMIETTYRYKTEHDKIEEVQKIMTEAKNGSRSSLEMFFILHMYPTPENFKNMVSLMQDPSFNENFQKYVTNLQEAEIQRRQEEAKKEEEEKKTRVASLKKERKATEKLQSSKSFK